jgi:Protein of unknown function (DUF2442)
MSIVESVEPRIQNVKVISDAIVAYLVDGRVVSVPLAWSWRLSEATAKQRARFKLIGDGQGVHWPEIDETSALKECFTACRHIVHKSLYVSVALKQMVIGLQLISG